MAPPSEWLFQAPSIYLKFSFFSIAKSIPLCSHVTCSGCFSFLAIVSKAALNMDEYQEWYNWLISRSILHFWETPHWLLLWIYQFTLPPEQRGTLLFPRPSPMPPCVALFSSSFFLFFNLSHSDLCKMKYQRNFNLQLLIT